MEKGGRGGQCDAMMFEDGGRGPRAKECRLPLQGEKGKKIHPTQNLQKRTELGQHLDFRPTRPRFRLLTYKTVR